MISSAVVDSNGSCRTRLSPTTTPRPSDRRTSAGTAAGEAGLGARGVDAGELGGTDGEEGTVVGDGSADGEGASPLLEPLQAHRRAARTTSGRAGRTPAVNQRPRPRGGEHAHDAPGHLRAVSREIGSRKTGAGPKADTRSSVRRNLVGLTGFEPATP